MPARRSTSKKTAAKTSTRAASDKLDLYAKHKNEYIAGKLPALVQVGPARYLAIAGRSAPGAEEFTRAIESLYNVAFTIRMARKFAGKDYAVTKLEGLWWRDAGASDPPDLFTIWNWQMLLRVPPFVSKREVASTIETLIAKGKSDNVRSVELIELTEGKCVQILHVGPYTEEQESIAKLRSFAEQAGRSLSGKHHEIYLSDPRRVKPPQLKTILRYPVV